MLKRILCQLIPSYNLDLYKIYMTSGAGIVCSSMLSDQELKKVRGIGKQQKRRITLRA